MLCFDLIILTLVLVALGFQHPDQKKAEELKIEETRIAKEQQLEDARVKKLIDSETAALEASKTSFKNDNRNTRLSVLKSLLTKYEEYKNGDEVLEEITTLYEKEIGDMRASFIVEYDNTVKTNTLDDIENIKESELLSSAKALLETQLKQIQDEKGVVCTDKEVSEYEESVGTLVTSYNARIVAIEKEDAELQAEAARIQKQEEAEQQAEAARIQEQEEAERQAEAARIKAQEEAERQAEAARINAANRSAQEQSDTWVEDTQTWQDDTQTWQEDTQSWQENTQSWQESQSSEYTR